MATRKTKGWLDWLQTLDPFSGQAAAEEDFANLRKERDDMITKDFKELKKIQAKKNVSPVVLKNDLEVVTKYVNCSEFEPDAFSAFASDLGITAAYVSSMGWPPQLQTEIGNGNPFVAHNKKKNDEGDLEYVTYYQKDSDIYLRVYND